MLDSVLFYLYKIYRSLPFLFSYDEERNPQIFEYIPLVSCEVSSLTFKNRLRIIKAQNQKYLKIFKFSEKLSLLLKEECSNGHWSQAFFHTTQLNEMNFWSA